MRDGKEILGNQKDLSFGGIIHLLWPIDPYFISLSGNNTVFQAGEEGLGELPSISALRRNSM